MTSNLTNAAQWLAINGPGLRALKKCRSLYGLNARDKATVCREASLLRSTAQHAPNTAGNAEVGIR